MELIVLKQLLAIIRLEEDIGACLIVCRLRYIGLQDSLGKRKGTNLSFAIGLHFEAGTEGIDRLHTHAVQSDALLESLGIVLATGIQHRHSLNKLSLRNAATVVTHGDTEFLVDVHLDTLSGIHLELVNGVVYHFLQQYINAVFRQRTVTKTTNIHTRAKPDMLDTCQGLDIVIGILNLLLLSFDYVFFLFHSAC